MSAPLARQALADLPRDLAVFPAVAMLGPRQAGKTTLAHPLAEQAGEPRPL